MGGWVGGWSYLICMGEGNLPLCLPSNEIALCLFYQMQKCHIKLTNSEITSMGNYCFKVRFISLQDYNDY